MKQIIEFLFGVRVEGEPANYPETTDLFERPLDQQFFEWCEDYNVGCRTKNKEIFY